MVNDTAMACDPMCAGIRCRAPPAFGRSVRGRRLDNATAPETVAIREYLAPYRLNGGPGTGDTELVPVLGPDEVVLVRRMSAQPMRAAQACIALPLDALEPVEA